MQLQAFTVVRDDEIEPRKDTVHNHTTKELTLSDEVLLAVTDGAAHGMKIETDEEVAYLSPVAVCQEYIVELLEGLQSSVKGGYSTTLRIQGKTHVASVKLAPSSGIVKHNVGKRVSEIVWNYAWLTESNKLVMFYVGKRKTKTVTMRSPRV